MNKFPISKETFSTLVPEQKQDVMFDLMLVQHEGIAQSSDKLDRLEKRFEHRKKIDTAVSGFFGLVGGMLAVVAKHIFVGK